MSPGVDGLLVVDKPLGVTSHDVVATARKKLGLKKVGHAGTLDPAASGVLVLGVGQATRLLPFLVGHDKTYRAIIRLGVSTLSDDAQGGVTQVNDTSNVSEGAIRSAMQEMIGTSMQEPPIVSARHVDGERAYQVVLRGEKPVLSPREVRINRFEFHSGTRQSAPDALGQPASAPAATPPAATTPAASAPEHIDIEVTCEVSTGTYIRAIARDLGNKLGVGGHVLELRRVKSGPWAENSAISVEEISASRLLPMAAVATSLFDSRRLSSDEVQDVSHGRPVAGSKNDSTGPIALLTPEGDLLALAQNVGAQLRPTTVFKAGALATS